ncbi:PKD domain-containing protein [Arthrobacter sp. USHLN218]|uniref:PKD domain-containing protein n=1 Tax=Arthrobacter sp. USHLN218 TaxID=3081232 RepID=UPI00301679DC
MTGFPYRSQFRRTLAVPIGAAILVSSLLPLGSDASAAEGDLPGYESGWGNTGVGVKSYYPVAGEGGRWTDSPLALPDPTTVYRYQPACLDDGRDNIDISCLAGLPECDDAEDGQVIIWEAASTDIQPLRWRQLQGYSCLYSENPNDVLDRIAEDILAAFRKLDIAAGDVVGQPSPHTLKGAHTNLYAVAGRQSRDFRLHGQDIHLEARPVQYTWNYGDATSKAYLTPGGPINRNQWGNPTVTSHVYRETGDYTVALTVTYRATYSVNGGPAVDVPGEADFVSPAQTISVWRSVVNNYADDCLENPNGAGC